MHAHLPHRRSSWLDTLKQTSTVRDGSETCSFAGTVLVPWDLGLLACRIQLLHAWRAALPPHTPMPACFSTTSHYRLNSTRRLSSLHHGNNSQHSPAAAAVHFIVSAIPPPYLPRTPTPFPPRFNAGISSGRGCAPPRLTTSDLGRAHYRMGDNSMQCPGT